MKHYRQRSIRFCLIIFLLSILFTPALFAGENENNTTASADETHGLYLSGWAVGQDSTLQHFIDLANRTEINAYVIDVKEDDGLVSYPSSVPQVKLLKTWTRKFDPAHIISELHKNHIRAIARIVCFKDPVLPNKRPDLAMKNKKGGNWKDNDGQSWLNPYNKETWNYLVNIAKEAVKLGFDEIQFDYVRFTNSGNMKTVDFGLNRPPKYEAINGFLAYARQQMPNVTISADVFGIICESPADEEGIGQYLELIGKNVDYLSPMVYPSHYGLGQSVNGVSFDKPDFEPYGVVYNAIAKAKDRVSLVKDYRAKFRPWLQDFTASYIGEGNYQTYGPEQVRQQIEAVYKNGYKGWIFWNINNQYSEAAFLPKNNSLTKGNLTQK
ncbi:putative glycoside hydrolase [Parabacteroides sp. FAFU027]|uniref:putative glycoside hydrolase n=1 Tax=Parabacteroides sp. FAFU027 TaxID=2922715 RepID=UPI001FAFA844|nr:putative glycoside hydrolase [Parabacteroides sp. FAFU027]